MASRWDVSGPGMRAVMLVAPLAFLGSFFGAYAANDARVQYAFLVLFFVSAGVMWWLVTRNFPCDESSDNG